jgi:transcriptional regulator with XRE-family HTH domain
VPSKQKVNARTKGARSTSSPVAREVESSVHETRVALGLRIRELRQRRHVSGRSLAEQTGVTSGFISQVEAGLATPSVANLVKIARTLNVKVGELFNADPPASAVVRREDRVGFEYPELGVAEQLLYSDNRVEISILLASPGAASGPELYTMDYETEFVFMLKGGFTSLLGEDEVKLRSGDAIHFSGSELHGWKNVAKTGAQALVVSVLPTAPQSTRRSRRLNSASSQNGGTST